MVAAVQRIGPYEVLEPSSEEMEKVREGRGLRKGKGPRKMDVAEARRERGQRCHSRACPSFLLSDKGPRGRVQE